MTDFERVKEYFDLIIQESEVKNDSLRGDILMNGTVITDLLTGESNEKNILEGC